MATTTSAVKTTSRPARADGVSARQVPAKQQKVDSDFGSTPTLFVASISGITRQMIGLQNKNGIYYAFDRSTISSGPLWQKRINVGGGYPPSGKAAITRL